MDVDAQNAAEQVVQGLAGIPGVGVAGAVAGCDVEHAVEPERHVAAVMPGRFPFDHELFGLRVDAKRLPAPPVNRLTRFIRSCGVSRSVAEDVDEAVLSIVGIETDRVNELLGNLE